MKKKAGTKEELIQMAEKAELGLKEIIPIYDPIIHDPKILLSK